MIRRRDFNTLFAFGAGGLLLAPPYKRAFAAGDTLQSMTVYDHGKTVRLDTGTREARHIAGECTRLLQTATGVLRLVVTPELIDRLKRGEYGLEIIPAQEASVEMARLPDQTVSYTRMFIPLSGDFAENVATVFTGRGETYNSVPYRNNASVKAMRSYIENVVAQMKKRTVYPPF